MVRRYRTLKMKVIFFFVPEKGYGVSIFLDTIYPDEYDNFDEIDEKDPIAAPPSYTNRPTFVAPSMESDPMDGVDMGQYGVRPCDKKVDLYILQPDRLNTSGQSNPLKGKLTNCHITGCER